MLCFRTCRYDDDRIMGTLHLNKLMNPAFSLCKAIFPVSRSIQLCLRKFLYDTVKPVFAHARLAREVTLWQPEAGIAQASLIATRICQHCPGKYCWDKRKLAMSRYDFLWAGKDRIALASFAVTRGSQQCLGNHETRSTTHFAWSIKLFSFNVSQKLPSYLIAVAVDQIG